MGLATFHSTYTKVKFWDLPVLWVPGDQKFFKHCLGYVRKHLVQLGSKIIPGNSVILLSQSHVGVMYLSEERKSHGIFPHISVRQNISIGLLAQIARAGIIDGTQELALAQDIIDDYRVKTASDETKIMHLSGGNQQKILIARSLMAAPKVMIFDEPTRGIDVNAKDEIYRLMQKIAEEQRIAIVLISSEIEELLKCSNRVLCLYEGHINDEVSGDALTESHLLNSIINTPKMNGRKTPSNGGNYV